MLRDPYQLTKEKLDVLDNLWWEEHGQMIDEEREEILCGPPCNRCGSEMEPHPTTMFGYSWICSNPDCGIAYRIKGSEKELFLKLRDQQMVLEIQKVRSKKE